LTKACLEFTIIDITKRNEDDQVVDPFIQCLSMPAACHYVFRRNFMKPATIALMPPNGYNVEPSSYKSIKWLKYIAYKNNIPIQHSRNGKKKLINKYKVDGWDPFNKTVDVFHGCGFHGCPKCFYAKSYNALMNETFAQTFQKHQQRSEALKSFPEVKNVIVILECEYEEQILNDISSDTSF
jgi:hypothetical protein